MFDYQAKTEDELQLKKGDVIVLLTKVRKRLLTLCEFPDGLLRLHFLLLYVYPAKPVEPLSEIMCHIT